MATSGHVRHAPNSLQTKFSPQSRVPISKKMDAWKSHSQKIREWIGVYFSPEGYSLCLGNVRAALSNPFRFACFCCSLLSFLKAIVADVGVRCSHCTFCKTSACTELDCDREHCNSNTKAMGCARYARRCGGRGEGDRHRALLGDEPDHRVRLQAGRQAEVRCAPPRPLPLTSSHPQTQTNTLFHALAAFLKPTPTQWSLTSPNVLTDGSIVRRMDKNWRLGA